MTLETTDLWYLLQPFLLSSAVGLLMGLERERRPAAKAGLRTFALVAIFGALSAMLGQKSGNDWVIAAGFLVVGALIIVPYRAPAPGDDPGTTSMAALLVCYGLGALIWYGYPQLAVMLGILSTVLLYFKTELSGISARLTPRDLTSILQFCVLSLIVLPILPNRDFGPYSAFNPHQIWLMVVLISGLSLAGYAALRIVGTQYGAAVVGLLGGVVSSTATTLVFAKKARSDAGQIPTAMVVILLANLVMMARLGVIAALLAPGLLGSLAPVLGCGLLLGLAATAFAWHRLDAPGEPPLPELRNPTELRAAFAFGLLYAVVLFFSTWLSDIAGTKGLYAVSLVSGLSDVDAVTVSSLRLYALDKLAGAAAIISIALAVLANLAFKLGLAAAIGGAALGWRVLPGMVAAGVGIGAGLALFAR